MAKMRVHELAKELNIKSQDILDKLKNTKFDGKSASSNMEEEAQALVRGAFSKEAKPAADVKKTEVAKAGATKTADGKERPKKKSSITAVFNAQYSKQSRKPANGNNNNRGNGNGNGNNRRREDNKRPAQHSIIRPRPVGERAMRPISERTPSPTADLEDDRPSLPDEAALGVTYDNIDDYLEGKKLDEGTAKIIEGWYLKTEHKRHTPITVFDDFWKK